MSGDAIFATYNGIHELIAKSSVDIIREFRPDLLIAIGGGGFIPARQLRTFLKVQGSKNIPIQAIGLSLYEQLGVIPDVSITANGDADADDGLAKAETAGKEVIRTQWLDHSTLGATPLLGRKILIVDEVDDSRATLGYAVAELQKDVEDQLNLLPAEKRAQIKPTEFAIFVVHNKLKEKVAQLPKSVKYFSGQDVPDVWIHYPWESKDIQEHDRQAAAAAAKS